MRPTMYAALALGSLLALVSPAEARPVDAGSKAASYLTDSEIDYDDETLCFSVKSRRFKVPEAVCANILDVASRTLSTYFTELGVDTPARGILRKECTPSEIPVSDGTAYQAVAKVCVSLGLYEPSLVDAVLEDVDKQERLLEGRRYSAYARSTSITTSQSSGSSQGGSNKTITGTKNATVVESYGVTNRALPWIVALERVLEKTGFDDRQRGDVWKWAVHDGNVLKRQGVKSVYEALRDEMKMQKK